MKHFLYLDQLKSYCPGMFSSVDW